jgi:hypothetical protein
MCPQSGAGSNGAARCRRSFRSQRISHRFCAKIEYNTGTISSVMNVATARATAFDGTAKSFLVRLRIDTPLDTPLEVDYYRHRGILLYMIRQLVK